MFNIKTEKLTWFSTLMQEVQVTRNTSLLCLSFVHSIVLNYIFYFHRWETSFVHVFYSLVLYFLLPQVRDFSLGDNFPLIEAVELKEVELSKDKDTIEVMIIAALRFVIYNWSAVIFRWYSITLCVLQRAGINQFAKVKVYFDELKSKESLLGTVNTHSLYSL